MNYPYENEFLEYCKKQKHYADSTLLIVNRSLIIFWNYINSGAGENLALNNIQASDIQNFLNNLEIKLKLKESTINKYLSHVRLYFTFLYSHHLIAHYPMLEISGRKFNRQHVYKIDWMDKIEEIAQLKDIHPETIMMMIGIAQGYLPDEVLKLRYQTVEKKIKSSFLRKYLKNYLNFDNDANPYILGKKFGGYYPSDFHIAQKCIPDRKLIGMEITLQSLRLSYVYSILNRKNLTDQQLQDILHVKEKTLFCYRQNMMHYNQLIKFELPNN